MHFLENIFFFEKFSKNKITWNVIQSNGNISQAQRNERERKVFVKSHAKKNTR